MRMTSAAAVPGSIAAGSLWRRCGTIEYDFIAAPGVNMPSWNSTPKL